MSARRTQELALTAAPANSAVASPIEVARPADQKNNPAPRKTLASRQHATRPAVEVATELPDVDTQVHESPATVQAVPAVTNIPLITTPASGPSVRGDQPSEEGAGREPEGGVTRPGVIIRGGRGGLDPCDIHDARGGRGRIPTVLINPRVPGMDLPRDGRTGGGAPAGPSRGGGGGIRF